MLNKDYYSNHVLSLFHYKYPWLMKKLYLSTVLFCILCLQNLRATTVVIIESQSANVGHVMDANWLNVCSGLGYSAAIYPQTELTTNTWFATTDVLIVSSGVIALSNAQIDTIQSFLRYGGRVFLQTEYLSSYTTNIGFHQIVTANGGTFTWDANTTSGTLNPMVSSGSLATAPNAAGSITDFWYGDAGTAGGCGSYVEPFLQYGGQYYGFIFCMPTNNARMITTSDQDWVNDQNNNALMQNIVTNLASATYSCVSSGGTQLSVHLGPDTAICRGTNVTLNATTTGATGYLWSNGATTATTTISATGTYQVSVSGGCGTVADSVVVSYSPLPTVNLGNDTSTCAGHAITLVPVGNGAGNYLWSNGATTATVSVNAPGVYWAALTNACGSTADTIVVNPGMAPIVNLGNDTSVCSNQAVLLNAGNNSTTWQWSNGAQTQTINASPGNYSVTVTNTAGCVASDSIQIGTFQLSDSLVIQPALCSQNNGSIQVIMQTGTAPFNYSWAMGSSAAFITGLTAGTYQLTVSDASGCGKTIAAVVGTSHSIDIASSDSLICRGDSAHICAPSGFQTYLWNTSDTGRCISALASGNYYVTVYDAAHCSATSNHINVQVFNLPVDSVVINGDTLTCLTSGTYQWLLNGAVIAGAITNTVIATQSGNYQVKVTNAAGCFTISQKSDIQITGIAALSSSGRFKVYPNPLSGGSWQLEVSEELIGSTCMLYDAAGRLIYKSLITTEHSSIDLGLANGVYFMDLQAEKANYNLKLIKIN